MRFGFTLDGYEILAINKLVKPVPFLKRAWRKFESNHYKKHIKYEVSDIMLHIRLPWLYHTDLWIQDHCRWCGSMLGTRIELSRKTFKDIAQHCHPDGQMQQIGNMIFNEITCKHCYDEMLAQLYQENPMFVPD